MNCRCMGRLFFQNVNGGAFMKCRWCGCCRSLKRKFQINSFGHLCVGIYLLGSIAPFETWHSMYSQYFMSSSSSSFLFFCKHIRWYRIVRLYIRIKAARFMIYVLSIHVHIESGTDLYNSSLHVAMRSHASKWSFFPETNCFNST